MRRIILCEGETDATLIGQYLEKTCGWAYINPKNKIINIPKNFQAKTNRQLIMSKRMIVW